MQNFKSKILEIINETLSFDINNGIVGKESLADKICEMVTKNQEDNAVRKMIEGGAPEIIDEKHKQLP